MQPYQGAYPQQQQSYSPHTPTAGSSSTAAFPSPQHQTAYVNQGFDQRRSQASLPPDSRYSTNSTAQQSSIYDPSRRTSAHQIQSAPPPMTSSPSGSFSGRTPSSNHHYSQQQQHSASPSSGTIRSRPNLPSSRLSSDQQGESARPNRASTSVHRNSSTSIRPSSTLIPAPNYLQGSTQADHSTSTQSHRPDDCPGCQADLDAVIKASEASAFAEAKLRDQRHREEEEHWRAVQASEEEEKRRAKAEEEELQMVIQASERDEEEAQKKRREQQRQEDEHRLVLMEESRQMALREDESRIRQAHAELLERSRREAEEVARLRRQEEERMYAIEVAALEESKRELEEEWGRRDEEERAMAEYSRQGGKQGEAGYWHHLRQDQAYGLALEMNRNLSISNEGASSSRPSRRPLPPTPGLAALAAGVESPAAEEGETEWDHAGGETSEESDGEDPFADSAEAPPSYDDVRTDRPPEAPTSIPDHIRFAPPPQVVAPGHSNTTTVPSSLLRLEKTPVSADATPRSSLLNLPNVSPSAGEASSSTPFSPAGPVLEYSTKSVHSSSSTAGIAGASDESSHRSTPSQPVDAASTSMLLNRMGSHSSDRLSHDQEHSNSSLTTTTSHGNSSEATSSGTSLRQRTMKGTDYGYSNEPFSPVLKVEEEESIGKKHFPTVVTLRKVQGSLRERRAFFVIRAPSWKMLLRALAWYGNTRVEAGPEEIADSSHSIRLRVEVEFVTPTKVEIGTKKPVDSWKNAHVSMCVSLLDIATLKKEGDPLATEIKRSSRSLDASYLRRGSTRRVITLPSSQPPTLPLPMVRLAQHLHQAHVFSAACPSTSQTALHSPRDLTRAIDRHDLKYMAKLHRLRKEAGQSEGVVANDARRKNGVGGAGKDHDDGEDDGEEVDEDEGGEDEGGEDEEGMLDSGAVEVFDGKEVSDSTMSRMKARVKRKLAKRSGESNAVDQDLESWITPFDVHQHG
ncbi:hypothetical protein CBS101457_000856 [Exobasidium rhododendri]|nr:hypothetical protein CBS101457_000856 [Exobasidium rhododendri]